MDRARLYLASPPDPEPEGFAATLSDLLTAQDVACLRLALTSTDPARIARIADAAREVAHRFDVPVVLDRHVEFARSLGLDGVHLLDGARSVKSARKALGEDGIVGAECGGSRHDGLTAAELGADYVAFGPVRAPQGMGEAIAPDLLEWWAQMIEVPCVAHGGLDAESLAAASTHADFVLLGPEVWEAPDPVAALNALARARA
ncbi:MAG: thiamine phosphate synthase [Paracoccaceae bacterium]